MRLTAILLTAACLQVSANTTGQNVTLKVRNVPMKTVFKEIQKQTGLNVLIEQGLLDKAGKVTLDVRNLPVSEVLNICLKDEPLTYTMESGAIVVKPKALPSTQLLPNPPPPITITGRITNEAGEPVQASIMVKGTKHGTTSNADGYYELAGVDEKATLIISAVGIKTQEVKVNGSELLNITVAVDIKQEEEVVVAYNKISTRSNVGAVTVVKGDQIRDLPNRSVDKSLQGLVPGLLVTSGTGQPGGGLSNFVLRGIATNSSGTDDLLAYSTIRNPLIVIDGIPIYQDPQVIPQTILRDGSDVPNSNPMAQLNPSDIESISVLKDAAAIALYGAQANNGVILITTKKGKVGKSVITFRSQFDFAVRTKTDIKMLNQQEYLELLYETYRNTAPATTDAAILADLRSKFPNRSDGSFYPFTDLNSLLYKKNALTISNELSLSGGSERTTYYLNAEWTKQDGIYRSTGYDRKAFRINFQNRVNHKLSVGSNSTFSYNIQDMATGRANQFGSVFYSYPLNPVFLETGDIYLNYTVPIGGVSPYASQSFNYLQSLSYRAISGVFVEWSVFKNLKLTSRLGIDYLGTQTKEKHDPRLADANVSNQIGVGSIEDESIRNTNVITTNLLSYNKTFAKKHALNVLAGQEARQNTTKMLYLVGTHLRDNLVDEIDQTANIIKRGGGYGRQTSVSYFGQLNYDYQKKYYLSASIRSDGYSQFGDKQPFNTFWSAGAGWILSAEPFMKSVSSFLDYLKIRGSFGPSGNAAAIGKFQRFQQLIRLNYLNSSTTALVLDPSIPANSLIQPEISFSWNAGLEINLLKNRVSITADFYTRKSKNLIVKTDLPLSSGYLQVDDNLGDMVNRGVELAIQSDIVQSKKFVWRINANWSSNKNKLLRINNKFPFLVQGASGLANEEGRNFNSFYMPVWAGVNSTNGQGLFIDSTGKPNADAAAAKRQWVGKPQPDGFGSLTNTFNYAGVSLALQFYYQYGFQVYMQDRSLLDDGFSQFNNQERQALDRWQKPGDIVGNPKRLSNNSLNGIISTRNLFDGDFVRLQTVTLSFNLLPKTFVESLSMSSLRVYAQANNLALWSTKKPTADIGNVNIQGQLSFQYPLATTFSLGINATF